MAAAREAQLRHFVHVSIAGVDDIPTAYLQAKRSAEQIVMGAWLPYSILRATQFHHSLERRVRAMAAIPFVLPLPKAFVVQSVDVRARWCRSRVQGTHEHRAVRRARQGVVA